AILQFDPEGTLVWASPSTATVLGWDPAQLIGANGNFTCPEDLQETEAAFDAAVRDHAEEVRLRSRAVRGDGTRIWVDNTARLLWNQDGEYEGSICAIRDVTDQVEAEQALAASQEHYRILAEESSDFTLRTVDDFVVEWVSPSVTDVLGWRPDQIVGRNGFEFFHPHDVPATRAGANRLVEGQAASGRVRLRCADGSYRWVSQLAKPLIDDQGRLVAGIVGFRDVDARVRAEQALARSERRFRMAMESAPTGMAVVDLERRFLEVNPALCRMLARDEDWLLRHGMTDILDPADDELDLRMREEVMSGRVDSSSHRKRLITATGDVVWADHSVGLLRDDDGTPLSYVSQFLDVTAAHEAQERLQFLAGHDALTSLPNRHQLLSRLNGILEHGARSLANVAVLFVDLDKFKPINDTYGHAAGDAVLVEFARRLTTHVRNGDLVARLGGDEFIVALPGVQNLSDAQAVASKIHDAIAVPFTVGGAQVRTTVSIGLALARPGERADEVLRRADGALYRAKGGGRNRTVAEAEADAKAAAKAEAKAAKAQAKADKAAAKATAEADS
ncbi:MAG: domain S-box protein, partial [Actinomycetota bacterium]|nr:domain S-box protein [Actinomycetota bacterium]